MKPKPKMLTHKGTVPISYVAGRSKPHLLRVTIGGKRQKSYFATKEEALAEWNRLAPLAGHPGAAVTPNVEKSLVTDRDAAAFINLRDRLAKEGLTIEDAARLALVHKDAPTGNKRVKAKTVLAEFVSYLTTRETGISAPQIAKVKRLAGLWVAHFGEDRDIRDVKRGYEVDFAAWVKSLDYKPDTKLHVFTAVRQLLNFAVERKGYINYNPITHQLRKDGLLPAPRANQGHTLTLPQAQALFAMLEIHYPAITGNAAMQAFAGFREEQVERLRREYYKPHLRAFDLPPGVIRKARDGSVGDYLDNLPENLVAWIEFADKAIVADHESKPLPKDEEDRKAHEARSKELSEGKGDWPVLGRRTWARILERMTKLPEPFRLSEWPKNAFRHTAATVAYSHLGLERTIALLGWADAKMLRDQYAGKRWPAEPAAEYYGVRPGIAAKLIKKHPELEAHIHADLFPRGGVAGWTKPPGWQIKAA